MCRNIKPLFNFEPPASETEIYGAALQYVRKVSGASKPSQANQAALDQAVAEVAAITQKLLDVLVTNTPARDREIEAIKAKARSAVRFGPTAG